MRYPLQVWVFTLLTGPAFLIVLASFEKATRVLPVFALFFAATFIGLVLSMPALTLFWLIFELLRERNMKKSIKKLIMAVTGLALIWLSFFVLFDLSFNRGWNDLLLPFSYAIPLVFFVFFLKMPVSKNPSHPCENKSIDKLTTIYNHD